MFKMILLLLIVPILGLPFGDFIHNVVNRTSSVGHDLAYNIEQFRTYPGRILSPINKGELKFAWVLLSNSLIFFLTNFVIVNDQLVIS